MFEDFCKQIIKYPVYFNQFKERIHTLNSACQNIGWGYGYTIDDLAFGLEEAVKNSQNT